MPMDLGPLTVYANGRFARYDESKVGLLTHALNFGTGCFEGIRGFWSPDHEELYLLSLREHYERLVDSARTILIKLPHTVDEMIDITVELVARNGFREDIYIRPFGYKADERIGVRLHDISDAFAIVTMPFDKYFHTDDGLACGVSSWRRVDDNTAPARSKINGTYINSALAKSDAVLSGFDEAIMLSQDGHVSEGSAVNLFMIRDGVLYTPDASQNILEGVTRRTVMTLAAKELGLDIVERAIDRSELYVADEIFLTGSAAGIQWVKSVDHRQVGTGKAGPVATKIIALYEQLVRGKLPQYANVLTKTYAGRHVTA
jgi:branched-chain amino acid aminotransferase